MKIILLILLAISVNSFSQEFDEIWKNSNFNDIRSIFHDENENRVFVTDRTNYGTLWILNSDDGSVIDTIHTANIYTYINLSPDGNLLIIGNFGSTRIYDLLNKELISDFVTNGKTQFIDNQNIYYYVPDEGIFKSDILNQNIVKIWGNLPQFDKDKFPTKLTPISPNSCFSKDGKYALIDLIKSDARGELLLLDIENINILAKYEHFIDFPVFSSNSIDFAFVQSEKVKVYSVFNLEEPKYISSDIIIHTNDYKFNFSNDGESLYFYGAFDESFILYGENYQNKRGLKDQHPQSAIDINNKIVYSAHNNTARKINYNQILSTEKKTEMSSKIYPNPTSNIINIDTEMPLDIELFDIYGNKILEDYNTKLDIRNLTPGTYYIRYSNQTKMVVKL